MESPGTAGVPTEEDEERAEEERNKHFESCVPIFGFLHQVSICGCRLLGVAFNIRSSAPFSLTCSYALSPSTHRTGSTQRKTSVKCG